MWHKHKMKFPEFITRFPNVSIGLMPWHKGETKLTNPSLQKLSDTLKARKRWNFSKWQSERKRIRYTKLQRNEDLAELMGIILGDGNLYQHLRTECLRIICNSRDKKYIQHIAGLIDRVFLKAPSIYKRKNENATVVSLYQGKISKRLHLPCGNKIKNKVGVPGWILSNKIYMQRCLKGLFETDGCLCEDKNNYTSVIEFKNNCGRLREGVYDSLINLGYSPQFGSNYIRLAKKNEVYKFRDLIKFRIYN